MEENGGRIKDGKVVEQTMMEAGEKQKLCSFFFTWICAGLRSRRDKCAHPHRCSWPWRIASD